MSSAEVDTRAAADVQAVARVAHGDADALRELYERYGRLVYSFAYRVTGDHGLAEEATQDAFVSLWRKADTFDPARAKLTTWLFTITRNGAIEIMRRRSRRPEALGDVTHEDEDVDTAALIVAADESQRLAEAMAALPEEQLAVVRLAYFDGLSHTEIAEVIGIPLGTVKGRLRLALERLREVADTHDLRPGIR